MGNLRKALGKAKRRLWSWLRRGRAFFRTNRHHLRGALDHPREVVIDRGPIALKGWALDGQHAAAAVEIVLRGRIRISAQFDHDRPDVPLNLGEPRTTPACGWTGVVDFSSEPTGEARVQVIITDRAQHKYVVVDRLFLVHGDGLSGSVEIPDDGAMLKGDLLVVCGWASSVDGLSSIDVELDGDILGQARLGLPRLDVYQAEPDRYGPTCGFEFRSHVPSLAEGKERELAITTISPTGKRSRLALLHISFDGTAVVSAAEQESAHRLQQRTALASQRSSGTHSAKPRDLLIFTHSLALGGGELYLQDLIRGLLPTLQRCTLVSPSHGILATELEDLDVDVVVRRSGVPRDVATYEGAVRELVHFIQASGCSAVLLNTLNEFMAADAAQRCGLPSIWAIHESFTPSDWLDLNYGSGNVPPYIRTRLEASLQAAPRIVFEADATRAMYQDAGVPADATTTVPYGIDIEAIDTYATSFDRDDALLHLDLPPEATIVLCMGTFLDRKSQAWLVQAFQRVTDVHPSALLVLVGDHPSAYSTGVHDAIDILELSERVRTIPITADIWQWYSLADVLVSASDVESLPRSMLEAMAFGCPVLASAVQGVPELITDGATGWLMRPRDTNALIAGLHRVLSLDSSQRKKVGRAAREHVASSHRIEGWVATYLEFIDELEATRSRS